MTSGRRKHYSLREIAERFGGEVMGDGEVRVQQVATLESAGSGNIAFLANERYLPATEDHARRGGHRERSRGRSRRSSPRIVCANPYAYFARVSAFLNPPAPARAVIHPHARSSGRRATVRRAAEIGPYAVIETRRAASGRRA